MPTSTMAQLTYFCYGSYVEKSILIECKEKKVAIKHILGISNQEPLDSLSTQQ